MRTIALLALVSLAACDGAPAPVEAAPPGTIEVSGDPAIRIGDKVISQAMVDAVANRIPPQQLERMKAGPQWNQFLERIALTQMLYDEALDRKLQDNPDVQLTIAMSSRDVLAAELLDIIATEAVTDEKIEAAYNERKVQYARAQVNANHILVKEADLASSLKAQIDGGADFAKLAAENSVDPGSKTKGGALGWFEQGRMVKEFGDAAFAADKGQVIGPVETKFGFHIIQVVDKRDSIPLEEVKDQLADSLKNDAVREYMDKLKSEAQIFYGDDAKNPPADAPAKTDDAAKAGDHDGHDH